MARMLTFSFLAKLQPLKSAQFNITMMIVFLMCCPVGDSLGTSYAFFLSHSSFLESRIMPVFRDSIPSVAREHGWSLERTPTHGALTGIITCESFLVCDTHYYRGRTVPCERICNEQGDTIDDSPCAACKDKIGFRTHVYCSVFDVKKRVHFIFECTTNAAKTLQDYKLACGTLRGCIIHCTRPKGTSSSKVFIETNTANLLKQPLPNPPDIERALCVIWRIPLNALEPSVDHKKNGKIKPNIDRLKNMRTQADNMSSIEDSKKKFIEDLKSVD